MSDNAKGVNILVVMFLLFILEELGTSLNTDEHEDPCTDDARNAAEKGMGWSKWMSANEKILEFKLKLQHNIPQAMYPTSRNG